jgi:acid stress-induced BolA-like protein IbaG/YrbA
MPVTIRGKADEPLRQVARALRPFADAHPKADVVLYRQNSVSIRVRAISGHFHGMSRADREDEIWAALEALPENVLSEVSLLLLTPGEAKESFANQEFDHPVASPL